MSNDKLIASLKKMSDSRIYGGETAKAASDAIAAIQSQQEQIAGLQAKLDSVMLEYCPDEMTPEQIEEWGKHQTPASPETERAVQEALTKQKEEGK